MSTAPPETAAPTTVEEGLDAVDRALRDRHAAYLDALREEGLAPLRDALEEAAHAHESARKALDADEPPPREAAWAAVQRYRRAAMETVWRPLRSRLDTLRLGALLRDHAEALRAARADLADAVPDTLTRPEPAALYAPDPADGWPHRLGKAAVRGIRDAWAAVGATDPPTQTVPLAALVAHQAMIELPERQAPALQAAEQRIVKWMARLEQTAAAWTHRLLEIERLLDRPAFHEDEVADTATIPDPTADPATGVAAPDTDTLWAEGREQARALDQCLDAGRTLSLDDAADAFRKARTDTLDALRTAADRAGSFLAPRRRSAPSRSQKTARRRRRERRARWPDWHDEVLQRLAFLDALATLRDALTERCRALAADLVAAGPASARSVGADTQAALTDLRAELDDLLVAPEPGAEIDLVQAFDHQVEASDDLVEQRLLNPLRALTPRRSAQAVVETHKNAVTALLDDQPEGFVVHPLVDPDADAVEPGDAYTLSWRAECREVLDELLFDAWRRALSPLVAATEEATGRATEVRAVVQFNLGAALQELQDLRAARREGRAADDTFIENARELALGGLDRAADLLDAQAATLDHATGELLCDAWRTTTEVWTELHDRVRAAGRTRVHVLRLRGALVRGAHWLGVEATRRTQAATTQLRRTLLRVQRQARRLVRLGHAAVGTTPVDEAALRETVDALSSVDAVLADLPLVYRRLFSFRPIQDPNLLVARDTDRAAVERHATRWQEGLTSALVVTGPAGSGRTSLLNVLRKTAFRPARRHTIELTERVTSEHDFARTVIRALNLPLDPTADPSLDAVVDHMQDQPAPDRLRVCTIEHLEHAFHRTVGGTALGARILGFLSETDHRVLWIATMTDAAWQVVEASEPAAARLVARHALDPLDRAELEALIMTRHRRSGLGLTFDPPDESTHPLLSRRLRAADTEEHRQTVLQNEFFDRLHEACGQNVMLALFYWFRAVTLDPDTATLRVRPLDPVSFEVLDTLPLPHAFALKALLEHGTLTVEELADVLGVAPATSRSLLETLGNALLIAPAERVEGPGVFQFTSVTYETRYRIRPLLIQPVVRFLRSRNIVH
jgi:hypothetical protein